LNYNKHPQPHVIIKKSVDESLSDQKLTLKAHDDGSVTFDESVDEIAEQILRPILLPN
jgi:hypothetical protein